MGGHSGGNGCILVWKFNLGADSQQLPYASDGTYVEDAKDYFEV